MNILRLETVLGLTPFAPTAAVYDSPAFEESAGGYADPTILGWCRSADRAGCERIGGMPRASHSLYCRQRFLHHDQGPGLR
jgi:hypothetical protein